MMLIRRYWPTALVILVIIYATLFPDPAGVDSLPPLPYLDKLIHAIMFGGLAGAIAFDRRRAGFALTHRTMLLCCLGAAAFGAFIEVVQTWMNIGRSGDWFDFLADVVGIVVAYFTAPPAIKSLSHNIC